MKTTELTKWMMVCALGVFSMTSCSDDDDSNVNVPENVTRAFNDKYAGVGRVEWDRERGGYLVAEFNKDGKEYDAWFTETGEWVMTEVDHGRRMENLPEAVQAGYEATTYSAENWTIDDIDEIQRPAYETFYIIEVEKGGQPDYDLYFDANGTLFREVQGEGNYNGDLVGNQLPAEMQSFIDSEYPGARVVDFDSERNGYEVDVIHDGKSKEIWFDTQYNWVQTSTDVTRDIPANIRAAVEAQYPNKRIDDCDYVEPAQGEAYYLVDLDNYNKDLKVASDGTITEVDDY
jgi:hypothetical protein